MPTTSRTRSAPGSTPAPALPAPGPAMPGIEPADPAVAGGRPRLCTPQASGRARDSNPLARLDRADSSHDQLPVRVLDCQLPPTPPSSHIHTRHVAGVLRQILEPALPSRVRIQMPLRRASRNRSVCQTPCRISAGNRHVTKPSCGARRRALDHTLMVRWSRRAANSDSGGCMMQAPGALPC